MTKNIVLTILAFVLFGFLTASTALAAMNVRLEQPKSPSNSSGFDLVFVALDTAGNPITVKCYKKGPSEADFSQFGSDQNLVAGGNTGNCSVNSSVVSGEGTYQFKVNANGTDSNTVSVNIDTTGPGTPTSYSKEKTAPCDYTIHYTTAEDGGQTVKLEFYRSDNTSFDVDSGHKIGETGVGSGVTGTFINTVPECGKTYYFAIRAFDAAGNGSSAIGDSVVTVENQTVTQQAGQSGASSPLRANSSNSTEKVSGTQGDVLGEQLTQTPPATPSGAPDASNRENSLASKIAQNLWSVLAVGVLTIMAVVTLYRRFRKD